MDTTPTLLEQLQKALLRRHGGSLQGFLLPPPSFTAMQGELLAFDEAAGTLSARFPVLESQLNPYHTLQGGFMAAAADNTFGPLSLLVAPPNVTRRMELVYNRPASLETGYILVRARLVSQNERQLELTADILDPLGHRLARARATHWILPSAS
jgi:acyl-coenzyme A thioesterase PaaI-like protein